VQRDWLQLAGAWQELIDPGPLGFACPLLAGTSIGVSWLEFLVVYTLHKPWRSLIPSGISKLLVV